MSGELSLDIPRFLDARNPGELTKEERRLAEEKLARARAATPPAPVVDRDREVIEQLREEQRTTRLRGMQSRLERVRNLRQSGQPTSKVPTGAVWDTRTSRWVLPGREAETLSQIMSSSIGGDPRTTKQIMSDLKSRKERTMTTKTKPNFAAMTGQQLLDAYNGLSLTKRKAKFSDKAQGIAACEREWEASQSTPAGTPTTPKASKASKADKAKTVETTGVKLVAKAKGPTDGARAKKLAMVIHILDKQQRNPRREGTDAHRHFEAMRDRPTVLQYLERFDPEARRTAAQWLSNTVRDKLVEVREAK